MVPRSLSSEANPVDQIVEGLDQPRIYVDLNELVEPMLVLLSKEDTRTNSSGMRINLSEGLRVAIYSDDADSFGKRDFILAEGTVERNPQTTGWGSDVKWCCRIDHDSFHHESDVVYPPRGES